MNIPWGRFGGRLGVGFVVAGFILVFLGWNGAASVDRIQSQFPYLISGGLAGLCLVVVGAALMIVQTQREDRAQMQARLTEVREALERVAATTSSNGSAAPGGAVVAGPTSFHRPDCRLIQGRGDLPSMTVASALEARLRPCRTCKPPAGTDADETTELPPARPRKKTTRRR